MVLPASNEEKWRLSLLNGPLQKLLVLVLPVNDLDDHLLCGSLCIRYDDSHSHRPSTIEVLKL